MTLRQQADTWAKEFETKLVNAINARVKEKLLEASLLMGAPVRLISGNGVWLFQIKGQSLIGFPDDPESTDYSKIRLDNSSRLSIPLKVRNILGELNKELEEVASDYDVYPDDISFD